jgi:hypothetical protein
MHNDIRDLWAADAILTIDKLNRQPHLQGRHRLKPTADQKRKLYELKQGAFDSSEGAWAILSRHLQVVADNVPLSNHFVKHQHAVRTLTNSVSVTHLIYQSSKGGG